MLEMQVSGLDDVKRRLKEIGEQIGREVIDKACRTAALHFAKECKARCRSDVVRASIKVVRLPGADTPKQFTYLVTAGKNVRLAHLIEWGTKPHDIAPNLQRRQAMNRTRGLAGDGVHALQGPLLPGQESLGVVRTRGGHTVGVTGRTVIRIQDRYAPKVRHPGQKAKPFMRPGFDAANEQALRAFVWRAEREFKRLEREGDIAPQWGGGF